MIDTLPELFAAVYASARSSLHAYQVSVSASIDYPDAIKLQCRIKVRGEVFTCDQIWHLDSVRARRWPHDVIARDCAAIEHKMRKALSRA